MTTQREKVGSHLFSEGEFGGKVAHQQTSTHYINRLSRLKSRMLHTARWRRCGCPLPCVYKPAMKVAPLGPPLGSDQVKYLICHDLRSINTCFQALNPLLGCQNGDHKNTLIHVVNKFSWQILFPLRGESSHGCVFNRFLFIKNVSLRLKVASSLSKTGLQKYVRGFLKCTGQG